KKTPQNTRSPGKKKVLVKRTRKSKWDAESILSDPKSPLASAELRAVLTSPMAWDVLSREEQAEILALFPDNQHILSANTQDARPDFASLRNDDGFRYDCAAYTEGLAQGKHDPEWLASAWGAHERRKIGEFDEYLETKFKEEWDIDIPDEFTSRR
ncbi:ASX homology domain-containing protein, partial [Mariannaea sp. PMI_226]